MDPTATLTALLDTLARGEPDAALDHLADLQEYLSRSGFSPNVDEAIRQYRHVQIYS